MHEITKVADTLEIRIRKLLEKFDFLSVENDMLRKQLNSMQLEFNKVSQLAEIKTAEVHALKVAKTIEGSDYSKETTQKIESLVKEIDWCIDQLSV